MVNKKFNINSMADILKKYPHKLGVYKDLEKKDKVFLYAKILGEWVPYKCFTSLEMANKLRSEKGKRFSAKARRFY